jgi:glycosyltransferase
MFLNGWHTPHPTFFVKKWIYDQYGVFDTQFKIAADIDFMLRVLEINRVTTKYLPQLTLKQRNGGKSTSSLKNVFLAQKESLMALKKNKMKVKYFTYFYGKFSEKIKEYSIISFIKDFSSKLCVFLSC